MTQHPVTRVAQAAGLPSADATIGTPSSCSRWFGFLYDTFGTCGQQAETAFASSRRSREKGGSKERQLALPAFLVIATHAQMALHSSRQMSATGPQQQKRLVAVRNSRQVVVVPRAQQQQQRNTATHATAAAAPAVTTTTPTHVKPILTLPDGRPGYHPGPNGTWLTGEQERT